MIFVALYFRGEIKDLFEKVTKDELEKSILSGDQQKQDYMRYLIQAIPYHSDEIETLESLAKKSANTAAPLVQPEIPSELKKLFKEYGLLDKNGQPIELSPLPILPAVDNPSSAAVLENEEDEKLTLEEIQEKVRKSSLVNAKDYESFKPLEGGKKNVTSEMESFLKQFGLVDNQNSKKKKSTRTTKVPLNSAVPSIDSSYLIPGYSSLLDNIGIRTVKDKSGKKINSKPSRVDNKNKAGDDDFKKLEHLLDTIKELEKLNSSLTEKEIDRLNLNNFNFSQSLLSEGPDPVTYQQQYSALKNEVKRQQPTDEPTKLSLGGFDQPLLESSLESTDGGKDETTSTSSTSTTTESSIDETTTSTASTASTTTSAPDEQEKKNSLEDEIEPIEDPEPLPPPRRSGFYMLFDWNSFLEVGEDPDKIVVRFDPKIGDPSRFLPVNVP